MQPWHTALLIAAHFIHCFFATCWLVAQFLAAAKIEPTPINDCGTMITRVHILFFTHFIFSLCDSIALIYHILRPHVPMTKLSWFFLTSSIFINIALYYISIVLLSAVTSWSLCMHYLAQYPLNFIIILSEYTFFYIPLVVYHGSILKPTLIEHTATNLVLPRNYSTCSISTDVSDVCVICLNDYLLDKQVVRPYLCVHRFHQTCLDSWLATVTVNHLYACPLRCPK